MLDLCIWTQQYRLIFFRNTMQLEFQLRIYSILEDQTSPQKFITKNMQMLESVDPTSGGSLLLSFWGSHISSSGTTVILSLMRWWVVWRMSMQLALVKLTSLLSLAVNICVICILLLDAEESISNMEVYFLLKFQLTCLMVTHQAMTMTPWLLQYWWQGGVHWYTKIWRVPQNNWIGKSWNSHIELNTCYLIFYNLHSLTPHCILS